MAETPYTFDERSIGRVIQSTRDVERLLRPKSRGLRQHRPDTPYAMFAVRVWRDGGTTDGDASTQCDRTYTVRTLDATAVDEGGVLLGEDMTPVFRPSDVGKYVTPSTSGDGEIGQGYYDEDGEFQLFMAHEQLDASEC